MFFIFLKHQLKILSFLTFLFKLDHALLVHFIFKSRHNCLLLFKLFALVQTFSAFFLFQLFVSCSLLLLYFLSQLFFSFEFFFVQQFLVFRCQRVVKSVLVVLLSLSNIFLSNLSVQFLFYQSFSFFFP